MAEKRIVTVVVASGGNAVCGSDGTKAPSLDVFVRCAHTERGERSERVRPVEAARPKITR